MAGHPHLLRGPLGLVPGRAAEQSSLTPVANGTRKRSRWRLLVVLLSSGTLGKVEEEKADFTEEEPCSGKSQRGHTREMDRPEM